MSLIRTYTAADLGFILHSRHQFHWHTGYAPPQTTPCPHIGSLVARTLGPLNPDMPAFIDIGQRLTLGESEELKAFHTQLPRQRLRPLLRLESRGRAGQRPPRGRHVPLAL